MHLKNITIENFRCFDRLTIPLHPRLTVLVAENGGGKTSVLDGIAAGLAPVVRSFSTANQRLGDESSGILPEIQDTDFRQVASPKSKGGEQSTASDFARISLETTAGIKWEILRHSVGEKVTAESPEIQAYASRILSSFKTDAPEFMPVLAYYGATRGTIEVPERLRDSKVNYEYPTSSLAGALDPRTDFKEMLKWFDLEEAAELRAARDSSLPRDLTESQALATVRAALASLLGDAYVKPQFNDKHKFVVKTKTGPGELQVTQLSQGYQSMLALGMDYARRLALANPDFVSNFVDKKKARDQYAEHIAYFIAQWNPKDEEKPLLGPSWAPAVMLVDEIDLHLHPSWQQRVLHDLMRAFPGTQFIVTTHSPQVLSTVPSESIRIIKAGQVYSAPAGTDGADAQRILETVFQVHRRPDTEMARALEEYIRLVDRREWETPHALDLRAKLDKWSQGQEPSLLQADLQIENLKWEMGK